MDLDPEQTPPAGLHLGSSAQEVRGITVNVFENVT